MAIPLSALPTSKISFAEAARSLPSLRGNRPVSPQTLMRWASKGALMPDGTRLRLAAWRYGRAWFTTAEALESFATALAEASVPAATETARTPTQRTRASDRASEQLQAEGW
jgi:hypothetical protein